MPPGIPCELISWEDFYRLSRRLAFLIRESGFDPDMIVAIGRGGYMPARILSDYLGLMDLASMRILHYRGAHKEPQAKVCFPLNADPKKRRLLLVDDVSDTGDTFYVALDHILTRGKPADIRTVALHHKTVASYVPDFYAKKITEWRWLVYPWAINEDISTFIKEIDPAPQTIEALAQWLEQNHGIRLPQHQLADILAMMDHKIVHPGY